MYLYGNKIKIKIKKHERTRTYAIYGGQKNIYINENKNGKKERNNILHNARGGARGARAKASKSCVNEITVSGEPASGDVTAIYTEAHSAIVIVILIIIINRVNGGRAGERADGRAGGRAGGQ